MTEPEEAGTSHAPPDRVGEAVPPAARCRQRRPGCRACGDASRRGARSSRLTALDSFPAVLIARLLEAARLTAPGRTTTRVAARLRGAWAASGTRPRRGPALRTGRQPWRR